MKYCKSSITNFIKSGEVIYMLFHPIVTGGIKENHTD